jgi:hypothetical protein
MVHPPIGTFSRTFNVINDGRIIPVDGCDRDSWTGHSGIPGKVIKCFMPGTMT